jgi:hypothetical protein
MWKPYSYRVFVGGGIRTQIGTFSYHETSE